ncbi:MAG: hypothetical protein RIT14_747 [Pseudomonadota bacterium]
MPELIAKTALAGPAPLTLLSTTLAEVDIGPITSVAPYPGQGKAVDKLLKPLGLAFPAPNTASVSGAARLLWAGRDLAFLIGLAAPEGLSDHAALTDQSDGWACLSLSGPAAVDVLMRLVPIDLRDPAFPAGQTTRSGLNHMQLHITRTGADAFQLLVFRSMARTAWHELAEALQSLAARAAA